MTTPTTTTTPDGMAGRIEPGIRRIGGDMRGYSDAATTAPTGAAVLAILGAALPPGGRVLLAGPHDPALVSAIAGRGCRVELLLRGLDDARAARTRYGDAVEIACGVLDRLDRTYDAILALDGTGRLHGPDSTATSWTDTLDLLRRALRPDGVLALLVDNRFDLTRLGSATRPPAGDRPDGVPEPAAPAAVANAVVDALGAARLPVRAAYAVHPSRSRPDLLATAAAHAGDAAAALIAAVYRRDAGEPEAHLAEPGRLAGDAVRHGLGFALAPGWLMLAGAGSAPMPSDVPDLLVTEAAAGYWSVPQEITLTGTGAHRRPTDAGARVRMLGYVQRDPAALTGPVPLGDLMETGMLDACARHDHADLRGMLRRYARWLPAAGTTAAFASFDNVVVAPDGGILLFDPSWSFEQPVPVPVALLHAARRFADRLLSGAYPHPFPADASIDRIATTLVAMAGHTVSPADEEAATALAVDADPDAEGGEEAFVALRARFADPSPVRALAHREAVALIGRQATELADARAQIAWLDETIRERDEQLSLAGRMMAEIRASVTYRIGALVTRPARKVLTAVRKAGRG